MNELSKTLVDLDFSNLQGPRHLALLEKARETDKAQRILFQDLSFGGGHSNFMVY